MKKDMKTALISFCVFSLVMIGVGYLVCPGVGQALSAYFKERHQEASQPIATVAMPLKQESAPPIQIPASTTEDEAPVSIEATAAVEQPDQEPAPEEPLISVTVITPGEESQTDAGSPLSDESSSLQAKSDLTDEIAPQMTMMDEGVESAADETVFPAPADEVIASIPDKTEEAAETIETPGITQTPPDIPVAAAIDEIPQADEIQPDKPSAAPTPTPALSIMSDTEIEKRLKSLKNGESLDLGDGRVAYKVKKGDTFSQICKQIMGTGAQDAWKKEAERQGINYRAIYPGKILFFQSAYGN